MSDIAVAYLISLLVFLAMDILWIKLIARNFYHRTIGHLMSEDIKLIPATLFYMFYVAILCYLIICPNLAHGTIFDAAIGGALFGVIGYGTYCVTNYAILKNWPLSVTVIDLVWGAFVSSITAIVGFSIAMS